eukprot:4399510-Pyramimonas_sp.AAC.1
MRATCGRRCIDVTPYGTGAFIASCSIRLSRGGDSEPLACRNAAVSGRFKVNEVSEIIASRFAAGESDAFMLTSC